MTREEAYRLILSQMRLPPPEFSEEELSSLIRFVQASGIRPEGPGGAPFSLEGRRYLEPLYAEKRDKPFRRLVIMKAAQMGLTTRLMYRAAWWVADARRKVDVALMFPTQDAVLDLHKTRFRPMMRSSARMMRLIADVDAVEVVRIGVSNMRFRGMRSGVSVDSIPVDVLLFDEVRLMDVTTIERAFARVSASRLEGPEGRGIIELNSTAGFPGADIDYYFRRSSQHHWHTRCPNPACPNHKGFVMAFTWPDCVDPDRMVYRCPKCGRVIEDPQDGFYAPLGPEDAEWEGYAFNQILLGPKRLPELWRAYQRMVIEGANPSEFYNSYLGLPHRDPNAILVTGEVMDACRGLDPTYRWPAPGPHPEGWWTAMGVDQRGVEKHVVIARWGQGGRVYLAHLEVVERSGEEAAAYLAHLAREWGVDIVIVDAEPSYDLAVSLGRRLPRGMVWLADYVHDRPQPLEWSDQRDREAIRKSSGEAKWEFWVFIDRYKHLLQAQMLFVNRRVALPVDFEAKVQELRRLGQRMPVSLGLEFRSHFENIARTTIPRRRRDAEGREVEEEPRYTWRHLALDPHFVHAWGYAVAGLMRRGGTSEVVRPRERGALEPTGYQAQLPPDLRPQSQRKAECASCRYFRPNPDGEGMGLCQNPVVAGTLGVPPPVRTSPRTVGCHHHRR